MRGRMPAVVPFEITSNGGADVSVTTEAGSSKGGDGSMSGRFGRWGKVVAPHVAGRFPLADDDSARGGHHAIGSRGVQSSW